MDSSEECRDASIALGREQMELSPEIEKLVPLEVQLNG